MGRIRDLDEHEGKALLAGWGVPAVRETLVSSEDEAWAAARDLGLPVALKFCSADVHHKSDRGGVALDLGDEGAVRRAARDLLARFEGLAGSLLVQRMAPAGVEIVVGVRRDPVFGPVVLVGLGGIFAEILADTSIELAPVDEETAASMIGRLRGAPLLRGARGRPPVDVGAAAAAVAAMSRFAASRPDVLEAEVNPLVVHPLGAVAVDALVRLDLQAEPEHSEPRPPRETLDVFFDPSGMALVGASRTPGKGGWIVLSNMQRAGFLGEIVPVNPAGGEILGLPVCESAADLPGSPDLAMVMIPRAAVPEAIDQLASRGVRGVILSTAGYADVGSEGREAQEALARQVRARGMRLMGPNSIGTIHPRAGVATSIVTLDRIEPGGVSMIGQTGVFSAGWARWIGDQRPFGVAKVACIGNKADVDEADLLDWLGGDPETTAIGLYVEGVRDGERFVRVATDACRRKPVVVLKGGRSAAGAEATASHTGSLASSDAVWGAVCRRTGLLPAADAEAMFDALAALEKLPPPPGNRVGVLSITGHGCVASSDAAEDLGLVLPPLAEATRRRLAEVIPPWAPLRNPVDTWSAVEQHGTPRTMAHVCSCLLGQDDIDAVVAIFVLMPESDADVEAMLGPCVRERPDKPVLGVHLGGSDEEVRRFQRGFARIGVPTYPSPERALRALAAMVRRSDGHRARR